jgi:hypothetical protein
LDKEAMTSEQDPSAIPPQEWNTPEHRDDGPEGGTHALAHRAEHAIESADAESLPVLEAFQEFLETERQRSRRRIAILSSVFAVILCALAGWGIWFARSSLRPVRHDFMVMQADLESYQRKSARDARHIDNLLDRLGHQDRELRETVSQERQALAETRVNLEQETQGLRNDVDSMRGIIRDLQQENARLRQNLSGVESRVPALISQVQETLKRVETATPLAPLPEPASRGPLVLAVTPRGSERTVTWRLPLPE